MMRDCLILNILVFMVATVFLRHCRRMANFFDRRPLLLRVKEEELHTLLGMLPDNSRCKLDDEEYEAYYPRLQEPRPLEPECERSKDPQKRRSKLAAEYVFLSVFVSIVAEKNNQNIFF